MSGSSSGYQRRLQTQGGGGIVRGAPAAENSGLARAMAGLGETLGAIGADMGQRQAVRERERAIFQADEEARVAVIRDAEGNYVVEQRDPLTREGRVWNQSIAKRVVDDMNNRAVTDAVTLRGQASGDPARFQALWQGRTEGVVKNLPQWLQPEATAVLDRLGAEHMRGAASEAIGTERRLQAASWGMRREQLEKDGLGLAAAGVTAGPEWEAWQRNYDAHLSDGIRTHQLDGDAARVLREAVGEQTTGAAFVRATQERVRAGGTREEVLRDFDAKADEMKLPPAQRERLRNQVEGTLAEQQAIKNEGRTELHATAEDWQTRIAGGVPVSPDEGLRLANEADRLGLPRLAQQIRDTNAIRQDAQVYASLPTAELARKAQENAARVLRADASARDVKLSDLTGQMLQRRRAAMDADPLAAGAGVYRQTVGPLAALDFGNLETMPTALKAREQQARMISAREGRPVPVLTAPETEGLKTLLADGTADQQQALLSSLRGLSPSTMAATLDTLVKGDRTDPRVQAFTVAAARSGADPRQSAEILRGMEVMRQVKPAAVDGQDWRRVLAEEMGPVLAGRPDTLAQVGEAARAIYAQRFATGDKPGDLAAKLDTEKFRAILGEIVPTVTLGGGWFSSGQRIPTPRPGMTQSQFDEEMARMPAEALAGARAADGRTFTPQMLRSGGRLMPVGEGVYELRYNGHEVLGPDGRNFRLDMRQPFPVQTGAADGFRRSLARSEGGGRDLAAQNAEGFVGRYQFGTARLAELGLYEPASGESLKGNEWKGRITVPGMGSMTLAEYKKSEAAQERVADIHFAQIDKIMDEEGLVGRALASGNATTRGGLRAVAHLGGVEGMRRFVNTGGAYNPADSNGTTLAAYHRKFQDAV
jgi:hypothetical protein